MRCWDTVRVIRVGPKEKSCENFLEEDSFHVNSLSLFVVSARAGGQVSERGEKLMFGVVTPSWEHSRQILVQNGLTVKPKGGGTGALSAHHAASTSIGLWGWFVPSDWRGWVRGERGLLVFLPTLTAFLRGATVPPWPSSSTSVGMPSFQDSFHPRSDENILI